MVRKWMIVLLGAVMLMGAACGDDDTPSGSDDSTDAQETESPEEEPTDSEAPADGLTVTGVDYAFDLSSSTLPAGETEVTFVNDGEEKHQLIMARFTEDAPDIAELIKLPQKQSDKFIEEEINDGAKVIKPGDETNFTLDLEAGTYGMVCFVANDKGPHAFQGMFNSFTVE